MFGKSKGQKPRKRQTDGENSKPKPSLAQMGFLDIPNVSDLALGNIGEDDDNDSDLEAELLALTSGKDSNGPKRAKKLVNPENLDKMVAECMKDYDDDDQDLDEDDPELLAELSALGPEEDEELQNEETASPETSSASQDLPSEKSVPVIVRPSPFVAGSSVVNLLKERIEMYKEAEHNAVEMGETSRAKRFSRGLKSLNQMLKDVNNGKSINEEDIPPPVLRNSSRNNSTSDLANLSKSKSEPEPSNNNQQENLPTSTPTPKTIPQNIAFTENSRINEEPSSSPLSILLERQLEYKKAALAAKKTGLTEEALRLMKVVKQFEPLIQAAKEGQNIDIDSLPPPPHSEAGDVHTNEVNSASRNIVENETQTNDNESTIQPQPPPQVPVQSTPQTPTSVVEALEQRLVKYTEQRDKAKAEGNARKQRMNDRIIKQYQEAIRTHKMGRHFDFSELPTPPGFPPIPVGGSAQGPSAPMSLTSSNSTAAPQNFKTDSEEPQSKPESQPQPNPPAGAAQTSKPAPSVPNRQAPAAPPRAKMNVRKNPQSMVERQLSVLKRRHDQFKVAALEAKKKGEIEQAKEYVRNFKGIEQLISATEGGLPVDMNTVPIPPQEKLGCEDTSVDFEVIDKEDCVFGPTSDADSALTYSKLEEDLIAQIKMCAHTREHFKALGDVASANRFEQLILHTKKDLDAVRAAFKRGDTPPRFHYENRTFTLIQCNTDINDSDCEVCIIRGINFNVPNPTDIDTYVKIEFPYPSDAPPQERTNVVKDTNNPEFNHKVVFSIDRKARALSRVFKRHSVKCQVITKGGWFHRDNVLGNVKIPLVPLETKCTLHDSFDLIDDKKKMIGGKLEVKIRVRNPILSKQLEKVTEKWIIIDGF